MPLSSNKPLLSAALDRYAEGTRAVSKDAALSLTPHSKGVQGVVELVTEVMLLRVIVALGLSGEAARDAVFKISKCEALPESLKAEQEAVSTGRWQHD